MNQRGVEVNHDYLAARIERVLLGMIVLVAGFLRLYRFSSVPRGVLYDEAYNGVDALKILSGWRPIFLPANNGREALFQYLQAFAIGLAGQSDWALRLPSVVCGLLTLPVSYVLMRRLFGPRVALLGSAWLAVSFWHVMYSRIGLRTIMLPLVLAAAYYFLWLGFDRTAATDRPAASAGLVWFALGGAILGVSLYTYTTARFAPLVVLVFAGYLALFHRSLFVRAFPGFVVAAVTAFLVFAPEGLYFLQHRADFVMRAQEVSVFNRGLDASMHLQSTGEALLFSTVHSLGMFTFHGDDQWDRDIPGRPVFDPLSSVFLVLGLVLLIRRSREPRSAFVLIWLVIMLLPSILSVRNVPNFLRVTGLIPALFALPALGGEWVWGQWEKRAKHWARLLPSVLVTVAFLGGAYLTYGDYFVRWAHQPAVSETFGADRWLAIAAGRAEAQKTDEPVFVGAGDADEPLPRYELAAANHDDRVRAFDGARSLVFPVAPGSVAYIFPQRHLPPPLLLARYFGTASGQTIAFAPDGDTVQHYTLLSPRPDFTPSHPLPARFGDTLQLYGYDLPRDVQAGGVLTVRWYWKIIGPNPRELAFFNQLYDGDHRRRGQSDDRAFAPSYWPVGTTGISTFDVKVDPNSPTGAYALLVGVYVRDTLTRLPVIDSLGRTAGTQITLGPIKVHGVASAPPVVPHPQPVQLADGVTFQGYRL
ncbi:MAG TPA: glycosyltransferase family 39 protein, partial [Chloroflexota bacterium]|nr:glycosyltransferase family 39 protein [Chloroflexota bacterium]